MKNAGFTLLELIIAIVVMGILASALIFSWPGETVSANIIANQVASDLRYMQMVAVSRGNDYGIQFVPASNKYELYKANGASQQAFTHPYTNSNEVSYSSSVSMAFSSNLDTDKLVTFNDDGDPYKTELTNDTDDALTSIGQITVTASGKSFYVCVHPYTGMVEVLTSACS